MRSAAGCAAQRRRSRHAPDRARACAPPPRPRRAGEAPPPGPRPHPRDARRGARLPGGRGSRRGLARGAQGRPAEGPAPCWARPRHVQGLRLRRKQRSPSGGGERGRREEGGTARLSREKANFSRGRAPGAGPQGGREARAPGGAQPTSFCWGFPGACRCGPAPASSGRSAPRAWAQRPGLQRVGLSALDCGRKAHCYSADGE